MFWLLTKFVEAKRAAKVIGVPVVLVGAGRGNWINGHAANWVYDGRFSGYLFLAFFLSP
jgi:hypothetical protein